MKRPAISTTTTITPAQLQLLIEAAREKSSTDELYVRLLSQAGLRPKELEAFTMAMFDPKNGVLRLPNAVMKAGLGRVVPLQASLWKAISKANFVLNEPIFAGKDCARRLRRIGKEAGIKTSGMALRASYAVYRLSQTKNLRQVAVELGTNLQAVPPSIVLPANPAQAQAWFAV